MKDIKTFIIGFLTCACMFLIMGSGVLESGTLLREANKMLSWEKDIAIAIFIFALIFVLFLLSKIRGD